MKMFMLKIYLPKHVLALIIPAYRLFPVELFNITDQPLIASIANNYLIPVLPHT